MSDKSSNSQANEYRMPQRTGIWILLSSLLVNFFMLGLLVAPSFRPHPPFPPFGPPQGFIDNLAHGMPPADAEILRTAYLKEEPTLTMSRRLTRDAMQNVAKILSQPTVDQIELQKALADIATAREKIETAMSDLLKHVATELSPEGRRIFAENGLHPPGMPAFAGSRNMPPPNMMELPPHPDGP